MVSIKNMDKPKTDDLIKMVAAARGNSVPPLFMRAIARHVRREVLDNG